MESNITHKENETLNVLKIGCVRLDELEEMVKAFRLMNQNSRRKRVVITRENIHDPYNRVIVEKARDIDVSTVKLINRFYKGDKEFRVFCPVEGIAIVSDQLHDQTASFTNSIINQVMNIGGGIYQAFIDHVNSFEDLFCLLEKGLSPKLVISGVVSDEKQQHENTIIKELKTFDPHLRFLDVVHSRLKPEQLIKGSPSVLISENDEKSWQKFVLKVIDIYTRPYFMEELRMR